MSQKVINNPIFNLLVEVSSGNEDALDQLQENLAAASAAASTTPYHIKRRILGITSKSQTLAVPEDK